MVDPLFGPYLLGDDYYPRLALISAAYMDEQVRKRDVRMGQTASRTRRFSSSHNMSAIQTLDCAA
jgi:hypothetical protein